MSHVRALGRHVVAHMVQHVTRRLIGTPWLRRTSGSVRPQEVTLERVGDASPAWSEMIPPSEPDGGKQQQPHSTGRPRGGGRRCRGSRGLPVCSRSPQ